MNFPVLCTVVFSGGISFVVYGCVLVDCFCNNKLKHFNSLFFLSSCCKLCNRKLKLNAVNRVVWTSFMLLIIKWLDDLNSYYVTSSDVSIIVHNSCAIAVTLLTIAAEILADQLERCFDVKWWQVI